MFFHKVRISKRKQRINCDFWRRIRETKLLGSISRRSLNVNFRSLQHQRMKHATIIVSPTITAETSAPPSKVSRGTKTQVAFASLRNGHRSRTTRLAQTSASNTGTFAAIGGRGGFTRRHHRPPSASVVSGRSARVTTHRSADETPP